MLSIYRCSIYCMSDLGWRCEHARVKWCRNADPHNIDFCFGQKMLTPNKTRTGFRIVVRLVKLSHKSHQVKRQEIIGGRKTTVYVPYFRVYLKVYKILLYVFVINMNYMGDVHKVSKEWINMFRSMGGLF